MKKLSFLALIILGLAACQKSETVAQAPAAPEVAAPAVSTDTVAAPAASTAAVAAPAMEKKK